MVAETRTCQNCKNRFPVETDDLDFYKKMDVPPPTFCPDCREQRRIAFRNERALYKRKCDLCGKQIVSRVSPDKKYPVYCNNCWWSDNWNPLSYGREYDFSKPFLEQFYDLLLRTPQQSLGGSNNVNSEWVNQETDDKNCYLNVGGHYNEDSAYNTYELYGNNCFDNFWVIHSQLCYESNNCERCYRAVFSQNCFDSQDIYFCSDCRNCSFCLGCAGLRNKQYYIFNKPVSKKDYEEFISQRPFSSGSKLADVLKKAREIWNSVPSKNRLVAKSINVDGNHINNSKNSFDIWNADDTEDSKHIFIAAKLKDTHDCSCYGWGEKCYETAHSTGIYNGKFTIFSFGGSAESRQSSNLEYCILTSTSNNCFGCISVRNKEYCVLNKQYSKEEYEQLVPRIKKHMDDIPYQGKNGRIYRYGEFFPIEVSPFGYNETVAMDYFPLTREEALVRGYSWSDYESETKYEFSDYQIPNDIGDVKDDILDKVLRCEVSGKPYRIIPMELQFYKRMGLPIPKKSPLQRHEERMTKLLPRKIFKSKCQCAGKQSENRVYTNTIQHQHGDSPCPNEFQTSYAPERPEIVYCEQCYKSEFL